MTDSTTNYELPVLRSSAEALNSVRIRREAKDGPTTNLIMYTDGGSRGNPGPAAIGAVVYNEAGEEVIRLKRTIGVTTNNQAEYQALAMALEWVKVNYGTAIVHARLDSELVVKQVRREYKMKNAELKPWFEQVHGLIKDLGGQVVFEHVRREQNKVADYLVNQALDETGLISK